MSGGVVDRANAGFEEGRGFACETCHDTGEIDVMTQGLGPDDHMETIACPECGFKCERCPTSYEQGHRDGYQMGYAQGVKDK